MSPAALRLDARRIEAGCDADLLSLDLDVMSADPFEPNVPEMELLLARAGRGHVRDMIVPARTWCAKTSSPLSNCRCSRPSCLRASGAISKRRPTCVMRCRRSSASSPIGMECKAGVADGRQIAFTSEGHGQWHTKTSRRT